MLKILQIGNYPPPFCGWAVQTKLLVEEIRRRGNVCQVLNLSENRRKKSNDYIDVQNIFDYVCKVTRFAAKGYLFQVHVNGQSRTGYILSLIAALAGRIVGKPIILSWRGGLQQRYFPPAQNRWIRWAYRLLFQLSGRVSCNNLAIKQEIEKCGVANERVIAIPAFSSRHLEFHEVPLGPEMQAFLANHQPVFFCYVSFRPEYRLTVLQEAMLQFRKVHPSAGFIWLGFPAKEMPAVTDFVSRWPAFEREGLLVLGNLGHNEFLTLLQRSWAYVRTPVCDGVSSSVLESLALRIPVVASENGHRPEGVITYRETDAADLCASLIDVTTNHTRIRSNIQLSRTEDSIARTVDWLLTGSGAFHETQEGAFDHVT